ncbi:MAG: SRPBCC family protein [Acidobacteria bacterium]|jgi:uncharacterized protein YndB with AHSA1/START domain|nr:SRPBCC family protein [Acidobacteriota bacterium]
MSAMRLGIWFLLGLLGVLVAIPVGMALAGMFLPAAFTATRSVVLAAPPEATFALIADIPGQVEWRKGIERIERADGDGERETWREVYQGGRSMTLVTSESDPPRRLVRTIVAADGPFRGAWEFTVTDRPGGGSELTVTERGEIRSPLVRFASRYMFGREAYLDLYLGELRARLGGAAPAP